ncbi:MAG: M43 family zinc metalloprotease, partial [Bacteroidota bacterium]
MALRTTLPSVLVSLMVWLLMPFQNTLAQHAAEPHGNQHFHPSFSNEKSAPSCGFDEWKAEMRNINPDFDQWYENYKKHVIPSLLEAQAAKPTARGVNTLYIPVVVHVIHRPGEEIGEGQNLTTELIQGQLETLNEDFAALNAKFSETPDRWKASVGNPDIQFCLASIDPEGNATDGITRDEFIVTGATRQTSNIGREIQPATIWDPKKYFNIWTLPIPGTSAGGGVTGYATFPTIGVSNSNTDGAVLDYRWTGPGAGTLTHEAGHYLGLPHTFDGDSCNDDDGIDDTPNQGNDTNDTRRFNCNQGFPIGPMTCDGVEHMYINYMDYSPGSCVTSFTNGQ